MSNNNVFPPIYGFFDVIGSSITKTFQGMFDVVDQSTPQIILHTNSNTYTDKPVPVKGILKNGEAPIANVKLSFIKDYTINNNTNKQYNSNTSLIDYCYTDANGQYVAFIESGVYSIKIFGGKYDELISDQKLDGLNNEYYFTIDGLIKKRYQDVIEFIGTPKKLVTGFLWDQNKTPLVGTEIIITNNDVVLTYIKTDKQGKFSFAIENGTYDVRIRAKNQPVKIVNNFVFNDGDGFMTKLSQQIGLMGRDNRIWTLI